MENFLEKKVQTSDNEVGLSPVSVPQSQPQKLSGPLQNVVLPHIHTEVGITYMYNDSLNLKSSGIIYTKKTYYKQL